MQNLISINKAASLLDVHTNTLKRWDKEGRLKSIRLGPRGDRKYLLNDIEKFILDARRGRKNYPHHGGIVAAAAVMIFKENKVLIGKRTAEVGQGTFCFPGGGLPYGETFEECAINEAKDKAGISISTPKVICVTNNRGLISKYNRHGICIGLIAQYRGGAISDGRPEKIINFDWYNLDEVPKPMFEADGKILKCYLEKKFYVD